MDQEEPIKAEHIDIVLEVFNDWKLAREKVGLIFPILW
jgi:hypothetical protein